MISHGGVLNVLRLECLTTGFRFSVTHDDPLFGQSEPHDVCDKSPGDESLVQQPLFQNQQLQDGNGSEKPVTCDYLSPYAFTARNSLGSTSDYTRRRRPITLKIVPRLSLPCRSTSAPTTTDADWPFTR
ncbi:cAMP-specific 3',5'-cyclic phosphodiesterase isoform X5 [Aphis craccivora]|uniref:cAMP-specific 3',5'-cyclic phosphodiesterase isoform X5 n=1 Tax=Aphis craccivora TaxID=307492 RepID=A0A6G0ZH06_APHCR|nr:cAMP-specific 3',5'-cyclic phosphodiesterase isoform X5 [Aphis craccivora]